MDLSLNSERKNEQNRYFNIAFLGIFLTEIILCIIGLVISITDTNPLIVLVFTIFMSGIYTVSYFLLAATLIIVLILFYL